MFSILDITDDSDDVQSKHFGLSDEHRYQYGSALNHILADDRNTRQEKTFF